jgi:hypothetical protein
MDCNFYSAYTSTILVPSDKGRFWCTLDTTATSYSKRLSRIGGGEP